MNCPGCGSASVSIEVGPTGTGRLVALVVRADEGDAIEVVRACWTCGWREAREVVVDSIAVQPGDPDVVTRRRLVDRLTENVSGLEEDELRDALAAVERVGER